MVWHNKNHNNRQFVVNGNDCLRLPTVKTISIFRRTLALLIVTLLEISSWAFLFAWRLESAILERSKLPQPIFNFNNSNNKVPLYQIVDPSLTFIPRIYILILIIKTFTAPENPLDPSTFTKYSYHFLVFYSLIFVSAIVRAFDCYLTNSYSPDSFTVEKLFTFVDLLLCFILWFIIISSPSEIDHRELVDFEDDDHSVLVLYDGRVVRNGRILSLESSASPLSSITFSWIKPLLKSAVKCKLMETSLWALPLRQRARENFELFTKTKECYTTKITALNLTRRIYLANRKIIFFQFVTATGAVVFHYANPIFLRKLLNFIQIYHDHHHQHQQSDDNYNTSLEKKTGYVYCLTLFICNVASILIASQTLLWGRRWHISLTHMLNSEIYVHALRLKKGYETTTSFCNNAIPENDENGDSSDELASLINQDTQRLAELASYLHVRIIFLYNILGNSFLAGLVVMVVSLPLTHYINRRIMVAQSCLTDAKSWRLKLLYGLCEGMRTIKFLALERRWEQAIMNARGNEIVNLIKLYTQDTILSLIWLATPVFITVVSFIWYTMVEKKSLDASLDNIARFLNMQNNVYDEKNIILQQQPYNEQVKIGFLPALSIFEWGNDKESRASFRLFIPSIQFPPGKLSVISGTSKSGKTSLLSALFNEMHMIAGEQLPVLPSRFLAFQGRNQSLARNGAYYLHKVAYVAQTAWVTNGTLRENILFTEPWDDTRYRTVLYQCDLVRDLSLFSNGDLTLTRDKGISTSVYIQNKISLARAVYSKAQTVIIDDIFVTFGRLTSTFIYENCIRGELMKGRTIIVSTTYPDMFWARDAQLFIYMASPNKYEGRVETIETDPEKIVDFIKKRRAEQSDQKILPEYNSIPILNNIHIPIDEVNSLFENMSVDGLNGSSALEEDEFVDGVSNMPESLEDEEEKEKDEACRRARDYAYATYYSVCGGWKYWITAILFTLLPRLIYILENFWLKEGT
ncbi:uncharacterized protein BX663DRAFT_442359 [Cokeromyces recurvatus]|uniref:uncharacterized protein n=1 Tax=Cokeromyces recurvatus TaxID=90255 RepID=UPI00221FFAB4|nr:uncharacterized protein BX663DRAFT_442359 [Cokeromyces recurvatus]KAI7898810.1 hypothetical protein BX663DRAFT_442359 [Cokeromyces recurvatus]